jgi:2-C-methyl-D-erythritol 2,4-cyclodiphosphate synthase
MMAAIRVGLGTDRHRLGAGGPLRLGGIDIPHDAHLTGHSDADAVLHAITDALLGALSLGDIGRLFPDTDPENRGRNSADFVREAIGRIRSLGWSIGNIDVVIEAQQPKLAPHIPRMTATTASLLGVDADQLSIKAKTGESVGPTGRLEAIDVQAIALVVRTT